MGSKTIHQQASHIYHDPNVSAQRMLHIPHHQYVQSRTKTGPLQTQAYQFPKTSHASSQMFKMKWVQGRTVLST